MNPEALWTILQPQKALLFVWSHHNLSTPPESLISNNDESDELHTVTVTLLVQLIFKKISGIIANHHH